MISTVVRVKLAILRPRNMLPTRFSTSSAYPLGLFLGIGAADREGDDAAESIVIGGADLIERAGRIAARAGKPHPVGANLGQFDSAQIGGDVGQQIALRVADLIEQLFRHTADRDPARRYRAPLVITALPSAWHSAIG